MRAGRAWLWGITGSRGGFEGRRAPRGRRTGRTGRTDKTRGGGLFLHFDSEVVHDELAAVGGVATHVEAQDRRDGRFLEFFDAHRRQPHLGADEGLEFAGGDLAEAFEPGGLGAAQGFLGGVALGLGVAVAGFLLVADAEERGLMFTGFSPAER